MNVNIYQYMPQYMPDTYQYKIGAAHWFSPSIQVLACILVCINMYCASIWFVLCNDTSILANISIHTNMYNTYNFPIHTNTSQYVQINAIHTIHTNAFQYRSVLSNTYQYRHVQTNTYQSWYAQYISLLTYKYIHYIPTNTDQYIPYMPIHTNTFDTGQYRWIYINTIQYIPICTIHIIFPYMPILTNAYEYLHIWPLNTYQYLPIYVIHTKNSTYQYMP